jgi:hypothetical protein
MQKDNIHRLMEVPSGWHQKPQNHELVPIFAVAGEIVTYVTCEFSGNVPAKSRYIKMCLLDNLADSADSGGLPPGI